MSDSSGMIPFPRKAPLDLTEPHFPVVSGRC
ncbi:hypothetical protein E4P36_11785 [Streptomyces sp. 4R-3d]|nr:hypothetical protein E4P36_11785 [Streptomyces sp. 4R-3d]